MEGKVMSTITVTSATPRLNILKAFAMRTGNTNAASTISKLMERSSSLTTSVKGFGAKTSSWAKTPLGVGIISGLLSDERILVSLINSTAVALRVTGDIAKMVISLPVYVVDKAIEIVTAGIARVNEKAAIAFDSVAKVPVRMSYWAINALSSAVSRIYRRVEFSATSPDVINATAGAALVVSVVQALKHTPGVRVLGEPLARALGSLPLVGKGFAAAGASGWVPLAIVGTAFLSMTVADMLLRFKTTGWNWTITSKPLTNEAVTVEPEETTPEEQPVEENPAEELVFVTVDGNAYTEEEAIAISRKVMAANRRRRQGSSSPKPKK